MKKLIDDLQSALSAVFRGEDYQTRRGALDEAFQKKQAEAFSELRERAAGKGIVILRTPVGFAMAPGQEGHIIPPDEFNSWPEAKRNEIQATIQELEKDLEHIIHQIPLWEKQRREEIRELNRETASYAAGQLINETVAPFRDIPRIIQHIDAVRSDLIENVEMFVASSEDGEGQRQWRARNANLQTRRLRNGRGQPPDTTRADMRDDGKTARPLRPFHDLRKCGRIEETAFC